MEQEKDILQPIPLEDIPKLMNLYKKDLPRALYIYNYLNSAIRWNKEEPEKKYITILAPYGNWEEGTFVGINRFWCNEIFMFTLDENCKTLCEALKTTKRIDWKCGSILYALYYPYHEKILKTLEGTEFLPSLLDVCRHCWIPKDKAIEYKINCPDDVYVTKLEPDHALVINPRWNPRYPDSEKYIAKLIEKNGGYGVFLKSSGKLVSWIVRNLLGMGILYTLEEHRKKGYGKLVTKVLAKELAQDGIDAVGTVNFENEQSLSMFLSIGFEIFESVVFVPSFYGYELFMFTLADDCKVLQEVLIKSKEINWNCSMVLYGIYLDHYPMVQNALEKTEFKYLNSDICDLWWMPKETALKLEYSCPDEVYVAKLNPNHAIIINDNWPYRYPESDNYFAKLIEMNGGYGVFLKSDGSLVSWIVRNLIGFGALQTLEQHKRKNYASLVLTAMVKSIAENGVHPVGSVVRKNVVSQAFFKKQGFKILESVVFSENQERRR